MIKPNITIIIAISAMLSLPAWAAEGVEEKASLDTIPAAAAKALKEHAGAAKITNVSKEKENGKTVYEGTFTAKGRVHDVTVDDDGKLVSDEEVVPLSEAPAAVRAAIEKEHPGGKVQKFERIKEGGKVSYEALISSKGKREEIKFDSNGKVLEREDKTGEKDND
jgi:uncharacterized membrane protein YkoI